MLQGLASLERLVRIYTSLVRAVSTDLTQVLSLLEGKMPAREVRHRSGSYKDAVSNSVDRRLRAGQTTPDPQRLFRRRFARVEPTTANTRMATSMATRKVMASASVARRLAVPLYRHASTSTAPSPSQPSTSSLASPIKADKTSTFRELKLALIDRTLAVAREAGLVRMTDAEATVVRNQERDALIGKKGVDPGLVPKKKGKKPRKKSLRYMSEDEIAAMERAKAEALEEKEEVKFVRQKALEHPGIKALQLSEHTASVTLELAAASSHDLKQFPCVGFRLHMLFLY